MYQDNCLIFSSYHQKCFDKRPGFLKFKSTFLLVDFGLTTLIGLFFTFMDGHVPLHLL